MSGRKLGQYELRERLGRGGMAEVYKAYQASMDRFVAVKVMLAHIADEAEFVERFRREAQAVGKLRHPHIVQIFDFGIQDDLYYMAMEFIQGGTLKAYIDSEGVLPPAESLRIARQLADALGYAHDAGMIHRDLKPANVMFTDAAHQSAVLTDFGIARILGQSGLTGTGMSVGTPDYMSPEMGKGEDSDHRADIYALGIILYEMLTGQVPYSADTPLAVLLKHIQAPLPTRSDYGDNIPEPVEKIILRCLAKDPDDRFATAQALKGALEQAIASLDSGAATEQAAHPLEPATTVKADAPTRPAPAPAPDKTNVNEWVATRPQRVSEPRRDEAELTEARRTTQPAEPPQQARSTAAIAVIIAVLLIGGAAFALVPSLITGEETPPTAESAEPTAAPLVAQASDEGVLTAAPTRTARPTDEPPSPTAAPTDERGLDADEGQPITLIYAGERPPHPDNLRLLSGYSAQIDMAERAILTGNFEELRQTLEAALDENPDDVEALFARSQLNIELFQQEAAIADAQRLIVLDSGNPLSFIALYDAQVHFNLDELAADTIRQAHTFAPDDPQVMWRYAQATADWDEAGDALMRAEAAGARGARFMLYAGQTFFDNGDYARAIPYQEVLDQSDTLAATDENRANLIGSLLLTGQEDAALDLARETARAEDDPQLLGEMAFVAYRAGDLDQAFQWARRAIALDDEAYQALWIQGLLAWEQDGDLSDAMDKLDALREPLANGDFYPRYLNLRYGHDLVWDIARIFAAAERYDDALLAYDEYLATDPWIASIYEERALVHLALDNPEAARLDYLRAIDIAESSGDLDDAERLLQQIEQLATEAGD